MKDNLVKQRSYAAGFEGLSKSAKEKFVVEKWLEWIGKYRYLGEGPFNSSPDCVVLDSNSNRIAVEVVELVDGGAIVKNENGERVYRDWSSKQIVKKMSEILDIKDKKKYQDGPYSKIIVLIHTDEPVITYGSSKDVLNNHKFGQLEKINEVFFVFYYDPSYKGYPCVKLEFKQKPMSAFVFMAMTTIMSFKKRFRNIKDEISYVGIKTGDNVLDFGCGIGFNTIPASRKVGSKGKVFALDINSRAIEVVKRKVKKNDLDNVETILSGCNTKLDDNSIDIAYLHNTLPLVRDKEKVLDEIYRVLKVGGSLSYMSRAVSRSYGKDTIDNDRMKELLVSDNKYVLSKEKNGHLIFKKMK